MSWGSKTTSISGKCRIFAFLVCLGVWGHFLPTSGRQELMTGLIIGLQECRVEGLMLVVLPTEVITIVCMKGLTPDQLDDVNPDMILLEFTVSGYI